MTTPAPSRPWKADYNRNDVQTPTEQTGQYHVYVEHLRNGQVIGTYWVAAHLSRNHADGLSQVNLPVEQGDVVRHRIRYGLHDYQEFNDARFTSSAQGEHDYVDWEIPVVVG